MVEFEAAASPVHIVQGVRGSCGSHALSALLCALALATAACGEDETEPTCGTIDAPLLLELADLTPTTGSSVPNADVVQGFTIVSFDAVISDFSFALSGLHGAGQPTPATFSITRTAVAKEAVRYDFAPISWATPGHVELVDRAVYRTGECVYALPTPLFAYDVTAP